jgi:phage shock protein E
MKRATGLLTTLVLLTACAWNGQNATGPRITTTELADRIEAGSAPAILDVRSEGEFNDGHIPGAIHIPYGDLSDRLAELPIKKEGEVVVYCHSGLRAGWAEKTLDKAGYTNVRDLDGQWKAWEKGEYPFESTE